MQHDECASACEKFPDDKPDRVFLPRIKDPIPLRGNSAEMFVLSWNERLSIV